MRIPVNQIVEDPVQARGRGGDTGDGSGRRQPVSPGYRRSTRGTLPPVVRPAGDSSYVLVVGGRHWEEAVAAGETTIECSVQEDLTEQGVRELQLAEHYHAGRIPPMELGKAFMVYRDTYSVTQQELARRTGITPGTIHHYESLIRTLDPELGKHVDSGELTFKEARSIADISDFERQAEIAAPFLSGRLSSVYVERVVGLAKSAPDLPIEQIIGEVVNGRKAPAPEPPPVREPQEPGVFDTSRLAGAILDIAGELDALQLQAIPEYRRLRLISSLRILETRVSLALGFLNSGQAVESDVLRPMGEPAAAERTPVR
ncbi:MAG: ParB/RepB/Spo0J family partition protein [Chloroflexi bacterium]|nr:ParB/RepB/Spo0J family partition protein [Chloroflexota bacterium]